MPLLHNFIQVLQSLQMFSKAGACFWSCLPVPSTMLYFYFTYSHFPESGINPKVLGLIVGLHAAELIYIVLIPKAIMNLAPQSSVYTCLTHMRAPNKVVWASALLLFGVVLITGLNIRNNLSYEISYTAMHFFMMLYITIFGVFVGIICNSFEAKCR